MIQSNDDVIKTAQNNARKQVDQLIAFILSQCPDNETWREIPWADGYYWVSDKGRVLSLCNKEPRVLKPFCCNGYLYVDLFGHNRRINRLVGQLFCDNPEAKPIIHHTDDDKQNNNADNLLWATHSENTKAYYRSKSKAARSDDEKK